MDPSRCPRARRPLSLAHLRLGASLAARAKPESHLAAAAAQRKEVRAHLRRTGAGPVPQVFVRRDASRAEEARTAREEARTDRAARADGGGRAWKAVLAANVRRGDRLRSVGDGRAERAGAVVVRMGFRPRARSSAAAAPTAAVQCSAVQCRAPKIGGAAAEIRMARRFPKCIGDSAQQ